jgi:cobalt-zinc-cadmium efflux system membrane fusion protein
MKWMGAMQLPLSFAALLLLAGCSGDASKNAAAEAPPPAQVEHEGGASIVQVEHAAQFPLATAAEYKAAPQLTVTGVVTPDISRTVPVISIASGRVVEIRARLGDTVKKGQLLLRVQSADIAGAYSDYRKAVADELLANTQFERAKGLYDHGAISLNDFQVAEGTENKAKVDVETTAEHLRVLGSPLDHPSGIVDIVAPVAGVITDQQVTNAAGVQGLSSTNPFTISDLTYVWILCDVYENDLSNVRLWSPGVSATSARS